ncbi:MAG TPA: DEAD/DEAH box helicase family protein, partial [Spirochaetota bacterium]|nr:DEAD/DEAH box helicase family protein [Spirochaetota bacterium]
MAFKLRKDYTPRGDQGAVIEAAVRTAREGRESQTIIGATGTGKTYVMASIINELKQPALVISHNKTLSAQLFKEFRFFFPENAVEYFVSYYDYYQPEAYVAKKDLYIEKDASINEEIEKYRLKATASLMSRPDVIIVASVSCIYGLGSPEDYKNMHLHLYKGQNIGREKIIRKLIDIQYKRNDDQLMAGNFRVRGDVIDLVPSYIDVGIRIELFGDEVEAIYELDVLNNKIINQREQTFVYPAKHFVLPHTKIEEAVGNIDKELKKRCAFFKKQNKLLEKERLWNKTRYDMEVLQTM